MNFTTLNHQGDTATRRLRWNYYVHPWRNCGCVCNINLTWANCVAYP